MTRMLTLVPVLTSLAFAAPALADDDSRRAKRMGNAVPLSMIIQMVERHYPVAYIKEVQRDDDDDNEWKIEYVSHHGRKFKLTVDAVTGHIKG